MKFPYPGDGTKGPGKPDKQGRFGAEELMREYFDVFVGKLVAARIPKQEAHIIVSEPFVKILLSEKTFPTLEEGWNYLRVSVNHELSDWYSQHGGPVLPDIEPEPEQSPEDAKIAMDTYLEIMQLVDELPPRAAEVAKLLLLDGWSTEMIAAELGIAEQTVRNIKNVGFKKLQQQLLDRGIAPRSKAIAAWKKKRKRK